MKPVTQIVALLFAAVLLFVGGLVLPAHAQTEETTTTEVTTTMVPPTTTTTAYVETRSGDPCMSELECAQVAARDLSRLRTEMLVAAFVCVLLLAAILMVLVGS